MLLCIPLLQQMLELVDAVFEVVHFRAHAFFRLALHDVDDFYLVDPGFELCIGHQKLIIGLWWFKMAIVEG